MKTEAELKAASRLQLCEFLGVPYDTDTSIDALYWDACALLDEKREAGEVVYTFAELEEKAKDRIRESWAPDYQWWDYVYEGFKECTAPEMGASADDMTFDLGQGGYAAWKGRMDLRKVLPLLFHKPEDVVKLEILLVLPLLPLTYPQ